MKTSIPFIACMVIASTTALATADIREEYAGRDTRAISHNAESRRQHQDAPHFVSSGSEQGLFQNDDARTEITLVDWKSPHEYSVTDFEADDVLDGIGVHTDSISRIFGDILAGPSEREPVLSGRRDSHPRGPSYDLTRNRGTRDRENHHQWSNDFERDYAGDFTPSSRFIPAPGGLPLAGLALFLAVGRRARWSRA